jgi:AdoMet-dependent heme synthase
MQLIRQPISDRKERPFIVIWETTQACDLACKHCRAEASTEHHPLMLSLEHGRLLIDQVAAFGQPYPLFVLTGGDPFKRQDIFELIQYASEKSLPVALSPSGTPLLNGENLAKVKEMGGKAISLSLDGSTAAIHDSFRQVDGSFDWTVKGWKIAHEVGLKIQINTTVTRYNLFDLPEIFRLVREMKAMTWSVFFLVPTGRGQIGDEISAQDYEAVMNFLYDASKYIGLKTTEGHHYKRVVLQRAFLEANQLPHQEYMQLNDTYTHLSRRLQDVSRGEAPARDRIRRTPMHVNAGDGFIFISLLGDVFPSGYLPVKAGNILDTPLMDIYKSSPIFQSLRNHENLKGRCGLCEFNWVCGGSRSRAFAVSGDLLGEEPYCAYIPNSFPFPEASQVVSNHI